MKKERHLITSRIKNVIIRCCILLLAIPLFPLAVDASHLMNEWTAFQQQTKEKKVTLKVTNKSLIHVLMAIKKQTGYAYAFRDSQIASKKELFTISVENVTVDEALRVLLKNTPYSFTTDKGVIVIQIKKKDAGAASNQKKIVVKGRVVDEKGNPMVGVAVIIHGTSKGVTTDVNGLYSIETLPDDVLRFSFVGYKPEVIPIKGEVKQNVRLNPTAESLEEVTVVAFGEQRKESVVSAITTINPSTLKSSSSDLTTQFAGKIAGMIGWQTGGIPGALTEEEMNTKFYIRGITSFQKDANKDPLILIDNVESSKLDLARIAPEDIETFSVMKDASATAMYGARGANGVILVTTKKGTEGSVYTSVRYEVISSSPTRKIEVVDPIEYMRMYNQAILSRNPNAMPKYSVERIERTGSPKYPSFIYPANDWYKILFKDFSVNHHMGVNVRGGSKVMQYYASVNYNYDEGMIKTDRLNQFDCNIKNNSINYRLNLNVDLAQGVRLILNSTAYLDKYHGPKYDVTQAYGMAFQASPVDFAPTYPADDYYSWPHLRFGQYQTPGKINPYLLTQMGYIERSRFSATNRLEYIHNLSRFVKGLELRGSVSLNKTGYYVNEFQTRPATYYCGPDQYDFETGKHTLIPLNVPKRTLLLADGISTQKTQIAYEVRGLHTAAWGAHQTSFTTVFGLQETMRSDVKTVLDAIPNRNMGLSMRASYGYKDRYFIEGSFGYNGSERFAKDHQWGFFPAVGGAWVASKEAFFVNNTSKWLSFLKFRLSWGQVGNDGVIKNPRYAHLPILSSMNVIGPLPGQMGGARPKMVSYPNEKIKWEIAEQTNLGVETKLFDGIFEATVDIYQEIRHNILDYRYTVPSSIGLEELQLANVGKVKSQGMDLSCKVQHAFSNDFWMILNGTFTYNRAEFLKIEEATDKPEWQVKKGHELSQSVGYIAEGLFRDQAEINNSPLQGGDVMPGDIRYRDLNNDGVIDVNDATYIGYPETPRVIYGFSGFFNLKDFEFAFSCENYYLSEP